MYQRKNVPITLNDLTNLTERSSSSDDDEFLFKTHNDKLLTDDTTDEWTTYPRTRLRRQPLRDPLSTGTTHTARTALLESLRLRARMRMTKRLAESTLKRRTYLHNTFQEFRKLMMLPPSESAMILCLEWMAKSVQPQTLLAYALTLRRIFPACTGPSLEDYLASLRVEAAAKGISQVDAMTKDEFILAFGMLPREAKWAFWLAWKTASRWADVSRVSSANIIPTSNADEIVVDFRHLTKASKTRPFRADMVVLVKDSVQNVQEFLEWTSHRAPRTPITPWTTERLAAFFKHLFPNRRLRAHSVKRGAANILIKSAADGLIPTELVAQILKHIGAAPLLPDTTIRYIEDRVALARANKSGLATALIPTS